MTTFDVIIIGGGASGLAAAISAARSGKSTLIVEKTPHLGKKILASGGGRCNLLNDQLDTSFYNEESHEFVAPTFEKFDKDKILHFFHQLGLHTYSDQGRIFPITNQASSVFEVLQLELSRLKVQIELNCDISAVKKSGASFLLKSKTGKEFQGRNVILACGGKSYPAFGSDGGSYKLAREFGHTLIEPVPSTVPLVVKDPLCHVLQGQKIFASITNLVRGRESRKTSGELLFTKYGLSGTAILDASEEISIAINRNHIQGVSILADLIPFLNEKGLATTIEAKTNAGIPAERLLTGILPKKLCHAFAALLKNIPPQKIAHELKNKRFAISATRGWNEAEFTAGGIDTNEVDAETLESKLIPGFYLTGEILNVQGRRGGYNLAWAWASGLVAGSAVKRA